MTPAELGIFLSDIPSKLIEAQRQLEVAINAYGDAADLEAKTEYEYRVAKSATIQILRGEGVQVGVCLDIANGDTAALKQSVMSAEGQKNKCKFLIEGMKERIFTLRYLGKSINENKRDL